MLECLGYKDGDLFTPLFAGTYAVSVMQRSLALAAGHRDLGQVLLPFGLLIGRTFCRVRLVLSEPSL
ncbi:MAG: hypothetical protein J2P54_20140 [Bradyrhizobiaceae bacterium]|nr:hypothetical protein [Bradyrhizobiaceae bacterium]